MPLPIALIGGIASAIPSIVKLFSSDEKEEGIKELTGKVLSEASERLGIELSSKDDLYNHLNANPDEVIKLRQMEQEVEKELIKFDGSIIENVNTTMQEESKSEHFMQFAWRPFIGFSFGMYLNSLWVLPLFSKVPTVMSVDMILTVGAILGVASWHRGMEKRDK